MIGAIIYLGIVLPLLAFGVVADYRATQKRKAYWDAENAKQQRLYEQAVAAFQPYLLAGRNAEETFKVEAAKSPKVTTP